MKKGPSPMRWSSGGAGSAGLKLSGVSDKLEWSFKSNEIILSLMLTVKGTGSESWKQGVF